MQRRRYLPFWSWSAVAYNGPQPVTPTEVADATAVPEPSPARLPIHGEIWILELVDGQPLIDGTYATLTIDGPRFGGFDGCNSFGDRHESGTPVVKPDGTISVPPFVRTAARCPTDAILDQTDRYPEAMTQQAKARSVDDRLHIIDGSGDLALVFFKQGSLAGRLFTLAGTAWQLVDSDGMYGDGPTTVIFLDDRVAVGTTACRDYQIGYSASNGRIRIPDKGMAGSTERCPRDAIDRERLYVEDFGWANEYAVGPAEGLQRMMVRTSRGKTLNFEPLAREPDRILGVQWRLIRFYEARSGGPGMRRLADTDVDPNADITATFGESAVEGALGCHRHAYREPVVKREHWSARTGRCPWEKRHWTWRTSAKTKRPCRPSKASILIIWKPRSATTFSWTGWGSSPTRATPSCLKQTPGHRKRPRSENSSVSRPPKNADRANGHTILT